MLMKFLNLKTSDNFLCYLEKIQKIEHVQWQPQYKFLFDNNGEMLVDDVFRFEEFDSEVKSAFEKIDPKLLTDDFKLPHIKKHKLAGHHMDIYDDDTLEIVGDIYREDIKLFGY